MEEKNDKGKERESEGGGRRRTDHHQGHGVPAPPPPRACSACLPALAHIKCTKGHIQLFMNGPRSFVYVKVVPRRYQKALSGGPILPNPLVTPQPREACPGSLQTEAGCTKYQRTKTPSHSTWHTCLLLLPCSLRRMPGPDRGQDDIFTGRKPLRMYAAHTFRFKRFTRFIS